MSTTVNTSVIYHQGEVRWTWQVSLHYLYEIYQVLSGQSCPRSSWQTSKRCGQNSDENCERSRVQVSKASQVHHQVIRWWFPDTVRESQGRSDPGCISWQNVDIWGPWLWVKVFGVYGRESMACRWCDVLCQQINANHTCGNIAVDHARHSPASDKA